jgi:hypothetical protein
VKTNINCENTRMKQWCNNQDVKLVQMRSSTTAGINKNEFAGPILYMCRECRKSLNGEVKIVKVVRLRAAP